MLKVDINLLFTVINVLVLFAAVRIFLWKPVHRILEERQKQADALLADAQAEKEKAQQLHAAREQELAALEEQKQAALEESRKQASEAYDQIVAEARSEAKKVLQKAEEEGLREKKVILREAQDEVRDMVIAATARVIGAKAGSDSDLYDSFLEKVGTTGDKGNS